jgi:membrane protease YdiL (CAAX protease family)
LISYLIQWNEQLTLPPQYAELEMMLRSSEALAAKLTKAFLSGEGMSSLIEKTIIIALLPAITEEFFFRGALQQFLRLQLKNIHAAIWITAIIFSAFHGQFFGFFPRLFLGALLGYVCVYTSSIWPAILMHFVNNFIAVLLVHYHLDEGQSIIFAEDYQFPIAVVIASMILTVAIIYFMFKQNDKKLE